MGDQIDINTSRRAQQLYAILDPGGVQCHGHHKGLVSGYCNACHRLETCVWIVHGLDRRWSWSFEGVGCPGYQ